MEKIMGLTFHKMIIGRFQEEGTQDAMLAASRQMVELLKDEPLVLLAIMPDKSYS